MLLVVYYTTPYNNRQIESRRKRQLAPDFRVFADSYAADSKRQNHRHEEPEVFAEARICANGANGIRTHDLLHAMQALSQLSYGPEVDG